MKKYKNSSTLLKLFKSRQSSMEEDLQIRATKGSKQFKRPSVGEVPSQNQINNNNGDDTTIQPAVNETVIESEWNVRKRNREATND